MTPVTSSIYPERILTSLWKILKDFSSEKECRIIGLKPTHEQDFVGTFPTVIIESDQPGSGHGTRVFIVPTRLLITDWLVLVPDSPSFLFPYLPPTCWSSQVMAPDRTQTPNKENGIRSNLVRHSGTWRLFTWFILDTRRSIRNTTNWKTP